MRVVIVGAGPCGAALATRLARAGDDRFAVALVEATPQAPRQWRGEALMPSGLHALELLGLLPLPAQVPQRALESWSIAVNGCPLFTLIEPLEEDTSAVCTLVSQPDWLEALLTPEHRPSQLRLEVNRAATGLLRQPDGRVAGVRLADGTELCADLVVACDGRTSAMRRQAGLCLQRTEHPIDVLWFRFAAQATPFPDKGFTTLIGPAGLASLFAGANGSVQLGWGISPGVPTPTLLPGAWAERLAGQAPAGLAAWLRRNADHLGSPKRFSVQVGLAERWWQPGLLLLGDAAHPMSPVRAQGLNMALRDAAVSADILLKVRNPDDLDAALARIEAARRPEVARLQQLQAHELRRGELLSRQPLLRHLAAAAAPSLGGAMGQYWRRQQQALRHGIVDLPGRP